MSRHALCPKFSLPFFLARFQNENGLVFFFLFFFFLFAVLLSKDSLLYLGVFTFGKKKKASLDGGDGWGAGGAALEFIFKLKKRGFFLLFFWQTCSQKKKSGL